MTPLSLPAYTALEILERSGRIYLLDHDLVAKVGEALELKGLSDADYDDQSADEDYALAEQVVRPALDELESCGLVFRGADGGGMFPLTGIHPRGIKKPDRVAAVRAALALGPRTETLAEARALGSRSRLSSLAA